MRSLVVLVQPEEFFANPETMKDNFFQAESAAGVTAAESAAADFKLAGLRELEVFEQQLASKGVLVRRVPFTKKDGSEGKPDAIFPNNSVSMHAVYTIGAITAPQLFAVLWPMSPGRRNEIPPKVLAALSKHCQVHDFRHIQDSPAPEKAPYVALEGTGALVFSQASDGLFVGVSPRADESTLRMLSTLEGLAPFRAPMLQEVHLFDGLDRNGRPVYHTNVLGWCGTRLTAWCFDGMKFAGDDAPEDDGERKTEGAPRYYSSRKAFMRFFALRQITVLDLTFDEMEGFAGNALELFDGERRPLLTISATAWKTLRPANRDAIVHIYGPTSIVVANVPTIERLGGGSVRCLQAHLNYTDSLGATVAAIAKDLE
jgi:hypothetical protein